MPRRPRWLRKLTSIHADTDEPAARGWRFYGSFGSLCLATFIIAIDATIISVALPTIALDIKASAIEAFWAGTGFLLASTVVQPIFTSFSHIFGRLPTLLAALTFFTVGTIMGGAARGVPLLLAGRTLQGIGAGAMLALTYVITTDLVSLRERGKWFSLISLTWAVGSIVGPIIGGALSQVHWPWIFWINLPFCAIAYVVMPLTLRLQRKEGNLVEKLLEFDWFGAALFVVSLTIFLVPLSWGGVQFSWSSAETLVPLILGLAGLVGFCLHISFSRHHFSPRSMFGSASAKRDRRRLDPLIRPSLFTSLTADVAYTNTTIHGILVWTLLYYLPLYSEVAKGDDALQAGVSIVPVMASVAPVAAVVGIVITRTGRYRELIWIGWACTLISMGLFTVLKTDTPTAGWVLVFFFGGLGLGILYSAQSFAIQAAASDADLPFAAGMYAFFRNLGQAIGVALGGVAFQNDFRRRIASNPDFADRADEWARDASALVLIVRSMGDSPEEAAAKHVIVEAYVDSLRTVWFIMMGLAALALVLALAGTKAKSLDRDLDTDQGLVVARPNESDTEKATKMVSSASVFSSTTATLTEV